ERGILCEEKRPGQPLRLVLDVLVPLPAPPVVEGRGGRVMKQSMAQLMGHVARLPTWQVRVLLDDLAARAADGGTRRDRPRTDRGEVMHGLRGAPTKVG